MRNSEWDLMNETELDAILQDSLPEPPPDDIANEVTPWRRSMNRVLVGLALNAITLNFLALDYILPAIGLVLMLLGFRALRKENVWFRCCFTLAVAKAAYFFPTLIMNATIFRSTLSEQPSLGVLSTLSFALTFLQFFCLWRAFKSVKTKAGLPANAGYAVALVVWYFLIALLALSGFDGTLAGTPMVIAYIFIIRGLIKLASEMDEVGYTITPAPVKVADRNVAIAILVILTVGITCGYLFGDSYRMAWTAAQPLQQTEVVAIRAHLIERGFPEDVLDDLTVEDILACKGALRVVVDVTDEAVNEGREERETVGNTTHIHTVYDVRELRITGVAVELPGEREQWKIFHHFRWLVHPGFYGTESIQLWPTSRDGSGGWGEFGDVTGQVLYTLEGQSYVAPYYSLGRETYTSNSIFWGEQTSTDVFAAFSMPSHSEDQRGYISYAIQEMQDGCIVDSWFNYTHQRGWLQYPAMTATEKQMAGGWNVDAIFFTVQDALQFYPTEDTIEKIGQ